ncbi:cytochrome P450 [Aspergillus ambiguus]|uniref:cytochrome P450 n=1 Tax=Aspergillus ambiguus TaxID=176160 RepID=UPI003CCDC9BD
MKMDILLNSLPSLSSTQWAIGGALLYLVIYLARAAYNLFLSPLARLPGPKFAAVSDAWYCYQWTSGRYVWRIEEAHRKYGPVVRIGPSEVSFATPQSFRDIYGHRTRGEQIFPKSRFYAVPQPEAGIVAERNVEKHRNTRRLLSHGFSLKSLKEQEAFLEDRLSLLVQQLRRVGGDGQRALSVKNWFHWMVFDIIGELAFGETFNALQSGKSHFWIDTIHDAGAMVGWFEVGRRLPLMWPLILCMLPTGMKGRFDRFLEYSRAMTRKRVQKKDHVQHADFFANLLASNAKERHNEEWLLANANVLVIAGSDTTATALTAITYYLGLNKDKQRALQDEIRGTFESAQMINADSLASLPYLNAVIEEGLRLFPPTAFGLPRESPGAMVDGVWIPKGTVVHTSSWTTTHDERYFTNPRSFIPERWLAPSHHRADATFRADEHDAAKPFSLGPRGCLGINLATLELRMVIARLAWEFDWTMSSGDDFDFEKEATFEGFWKVPDPLIKFKSRA